MLAYSSARIRTSVLTNSTIIKNRRLDQLCEIYNDNLSLQVSLDGGSPEHHDAYRGKGSWAQTVEGIRRLQDRSIRIRLSTTETPLNSPHLEEICEFHRNVLDIPDEDHFIRPLAKRGYSKEGMELDMSNTLPEVTVGIDGVFWHPLSTDADMQVRKDIFPLVDAVTIIREQLEKISSGDTPLITFT